MAKSDDDLVRLVNERIALQATRYVYGTDDTHLAFLEKRLGKGYANIAHQWTDKVRAASRLRIRR